MANALTSDGVTSQINEIHQFLHGYSDGHRLIEGSLKLPNDAARLMLRMSDLSGSSVVKGFERYLTGYPLDSINGYALAMTWYASEMPRPGSVWTHTLVLPVQAMAAITSLDSLIRLFKRPSRDSIKGQYAETLSFHNSPINYSHPGRSIDTLGQLSSLFFAYYEQSPSNPVVIASRTSDEFADAIFALWSQQWPGLRQQFAFCTGSFAARSLPDRPFDIQCSPPTLARDVAREVAADGIAEPVVLTDRDGLFSEVLRAAVEDAAIPDGGAFRRYLWAVTDPTSRRTDFVAYVRIFDALETKAEATTIVELIAEAFPEGSAGAGLKMRLVGSRHIKPLGESQQDILLALATTEKHSSFDIGSALNDELAARLFAESPDRTRQLVADLFRSNLNQFGDDLLTTLVRAMDVNDAQEVVREQPQFLPALFRANADLGASAALWSKAGDRRNELIDSLFAQEIRPELVSRIVAALLDSGSDGFIRRAFERWGKEAVFAALDWTEDHQGSMPETCRQALTSRVPCVMDWVQSGSRSTAALIAAAHVVAPYSYQIAKHDSSVWRRAYTDTKERGQEHEATYLQAFLLGLALRNAPPAPLDLIGECFEAIHRKVSWQQLGYDTWLILEPLVPELSWRKNWDKCERMRRGLLLAFMQNSWPAWEIRERIKDRELLRQILKSVRKVHGEGYFSDIHA